MYKIKIAVSNVNEPTLPKLKLALNQKKFVVRHPYLNKAQARTPLNTVLSTATEHCYLLHKLQTADNM